MSKNITIKDRFIASASLSWLQQLVQDPEAGKYAPNKSSREVKSGHYVPVLPTPLPGPQLIAITPDVCGLVGLSPDYCRTSSDFTRFFSGDMSAMSNGSDTSQGFQSWCTPYALSIFGHELYDNCPFKNGNGYGDGRAISVAEVLVEEDDERASRWEMQLKGAGRTPFCRGGDGRSVLRSSVREFLAEEAMYNLGVPTTRALSLIVSTTEQVARPWFTSSALRQQISIDDPRIAHYPLAQRKEIVKEVNGQPNAMIEEHTAIACRVAPSFIRVGHLELYSRRYRAALQKHGPDSSITKHAFMELRLLAEHMLFREFEGPAPSPPTGDEIAPVDAQLQTRILSALRESSLRIAKLTADWMRVGFCQGNFNSDNCLVAGRTLDYGPFGFVERYERNWCMWVGGGDKYSFRHQHLAGERNFYSFANALAPILDETGQKEVLEVIIPSHLPAAEQAICDVYKAKLGLLEWNKEASSLFDDIDLFMEETEADYTMLWRQLCLLPEMFLPALDAKYADVSPFADQYSDETLMIALSDVFYRSLKPTEITRWAALLRRWLTLLNDQRQQSTSSSSENNGLTGIDISSRMRLVNPKYVPREWMLVDAYTACSRGDKAPLETLQRLFSAPYDEQSEEDERKFFRKMPVELLDRGGVTVMT